MKLRSKPAVLILLALSALLLALLTLRTGRSKAPAPLAHPVSARQRPPALAPALILSQGTFTGTGQSAQRRRPLHPRPGAGNRDAASLEKLVRRPGEARSFHAVLPPKLWIHLAVVACGSRLEETLVMLKSAVLFSHRKMQFHIFTEESLKSEFDKQLRQWPDSYTKKFEHRIYPITFSVGNSQEWKKLFKPCAAQRLFLPVILKDVDSLLYVDTDVLFLRPVDDIWKFLRQFNSTQLAAMAPEHEIPKIGWYSRFAQHPFYGSTGINSGVMLMNLTRIRTAQFKNSVIPTGLAWEDMLYPLYQKYKNVITWGDQDLLNIIFYFNPERKERREKQRKRNINAWLPLVRPLLRTWSATQTSALTRN
ncbi:glucoside xylosyltransferase 2 isoform X2 [Desmodus rotundus]|uniref:glucoside xylosyltransferase 2 isoform X2 n=1 Tax=Desmodus rotundus TaxID=9430 RepID=UPI001E1BE48A|nr:glucoside xylosyltransferase 2 isoform X2 [Desmodus rotundus]